LDDRKEAIPLHLLILLILRIRRTLYLLALFDIKDLPAIIGTAYLCNIDSLCEEDIRGIIGGPMAHAILQYVR